MKILQNKNYKDEVDMNMISVLKLGDQVIKNPEEITKLDLSHLDNIEDICFLSRFSNLKTLNLGNCDNIKDLSPLLNLDKTNIRLPGITMEDLYLQESKPLVANGIYDGEIEVKNNIIIQRLSGKKFVVHSKKDLLDRIPGLKTGDKVEIRYKGGQVHNVSLARQKTLEKDLGRFR